MADANTEQKLLYRQNNNFIKVVGLAVQDAISGDTTYINDAEVTATLVDADGNHVAAEIDSLDLTASVSPPNSTGTYVGAVSSSFNPPVGSYALVIDAVSGPNEYHGRIPVMVLDRRNGG